MILAVNKRRLLVWGGGVLGLLAVVFVLARLALTGLLVDFLLQLGGASEIKFNVTRASPWTVVVEDIGFQVRTQPFAAKRLTVARAHWWTPSLGSVKVEQARIPYTIDGSDVNPAAWPTYKNGKAAVEPVRVPVENVSVDGEVIIQAAALPAQALTVKFAAQRTSAHTWAAQVQAAGPGLTLAADGDYDLAHDALQFKVPQVAIDLKVWQAFAQRLILLPGGPWELAGKIEGQGAGRLTGKKLAATATVRVREGEVRIAENDLAATGITADVEFADVEALTTKPGTLQVSALRVGQLAMQDIRAGFTLINGTRIHFTEASLQTLGGKVSTEPFNYFLNQREVEAVMLVEGIQIEQVMALTKDLPAQAKGRVNGRLPVRLDGSGVRLGTGWLALTPGVYAEIQFNASGLLTGGVSTNHPSYPVLKKIEAGLLKLKVSELRLDIRPPNAAPGRSAQLHVQGAPVDPEVKAPVILDLNVNGPLEQLLNLGLDSRVSFGSKP